METAIAGNDAIRSFVEEQSRRGSWPGAAWVVADGGGVLASGAAGLRAIEPEPLPATLETIYDLASLTKPLATAALLALLSEEGTISLDAPAERFFPGLACHREDRPTLLDLAVHRSGLPAWRPFYGHAGSPEEILDRVIALEPDSPCGARVVYSDPGYILLGEAIRRATGRRIDELFGERIAEPLGLPTLKFLPEEALRNRIAPTECGNRFEMALAASVENHTHPSQRCRSDPPADGDARASPVTGERPTVPGLRTDVIRGEVHDGNAHALGGAAGHAGLFGTASEVARLALEFLGRSGGLFAPRSVDLFQQNLTPGLEEARTLGWKLATAAAREAAGVLPPSAIGHTGFTGTSVWIDPEAGRVYVLLSNRVHPEVKPIEMAELRRRFHTLARSLA